MALVPGDYPFLVVWDQLALKHIDPEQREDVAKILDAAGRASWGVVYTDFHTPPVVKAALISLAARADIAAVAWGGYVQAERTRLAIGLPDRVAAIQSNLEESGRVAAVNVQGSFLFDPATHRDFLGACLGTGITRQKVGDIIVQGETGAEILVDPDLVEHLEMSLTQVRTVTVQTRALNLHKLHVPTPRSSTISSVEASLRLDAVASAGFRMSRSKMLDLIKKGDVRVNWAAGKASSMVQEKDVISCAGKGRLEVVQTTLTKKGRWAVELLRLT
ncbi:hypothetical protein WJX72_005464 [[Myrmecia] bisecta]|uniref:RNA-binding S4 domain-containing protein n=1 Tax=[Myrmecia] bisecta TaxID=41462 RepID=A0AAW1R7A1_9CHLO